MDIIWIRDEDSNSIWLPLVYQHIVQDNQIILHFGSFEQPMNVSFLNELHGDSIMIPESLGTKFMIPMNLPFEIRIKNNHVYIGPVIGYLLCNREEVINDLLEESVDYIQSYKEVKGLIFLFSAEGIDTLTQTIRGYYYNPVDGVGQDCWKSGVFPFPSSLYRRTFISNHIMSDLCKVIGSDCIFNSVYFHKWKMYKLLSIHPAVRSYLPETEKLTTITKLLVMVKKHTSVYLKPVNGTYGQGVGRLERTKEGYQYIGKSGRKYNLSTQKDVSDFVNRNVRKGSFIVQKDVGYQLQNRLVDFRVIIQKNRQRTWCCTAFIARYGLKNKIFTNDPSKIVHGCVALQRMFQLNDDQIQRKELEIIAQCKAIAKIIDQFGHYADLGFDIAIDQDLNIWVLEVNHVFQDHDMAAYLDDEDVTYERVLKTILDYLKTLAGF